MGDAARFYSASHSTPLWAAWLSSHPADVERAAKVSRLAAQLSEEQQAMCPPQLLERVTDMDLAIEAALTCDEACCRRSREELLKMHGHRRPITGGPAALA
jgi:glycerol-3-phosphate dehydrogenase